MYKLRLKITKLRWEMDKLQNKLSVIAKIITWMAIALLNAINSLPLRLGV